MVSFMAAFIKRCFLRCRCLLPCDCDVVDGFSHILSNLANASRFVSLRAERLASFAAGSAQLHPSFSPARSHAQRLLANQSGLDFRRVASDAYEHEPSTGGPPVPLPQHDKHNP